MDEANPDEARSDKPEQGGAPPIASRAGFVAALRWGLHTAFEQGARRIVCADVDWADWPVWDDPALLRALAAWLRRPQRRLVLLARRYDTLERRCPRFNSWRADWMHAIEAWQPPEDLTPELPTVLVSEGGESAVSVQLIDAQHWRGRAELDPRRARLWCEELDVVLQRSERTWAVRPLGL
jgi:hypothetical protein